MPTFDQILGDYLGPSDGLPVSTPVGPGGPSKTTDVLAASDRIKKELPAASQANRINAYDVSAAMSEGVAYDPNNQITQDLQSLPDWEFRQKYGAAAERILGEQALADAQFSADATSRRSLSEALGDTAIGIPAAAARGAFGISTLIAGAIDKDAGVLGAKIGQDFSEFYQGAQSDALANRRDAFGGRNRVQTADNARLGEDLGGGVLGTATRIGLDAGSVIENALSDPTIASDGVSEGVGSLLVGGPLAKGLKTIGAGIMARAGLSTAGRVGAAAEVATMPAVIGALEAGGTYTDTVNEVMSMSHEDLLASSEEYRSLIEKGIDPEEAKRTVAGQAGNTAAAIQGPIAAATGLITSRFEANPFRVESPAGAFSNAVKEAVEETVQSGAGAFAQNVGIRSNADENRDLASGVGEQAGLGGLYGFGTGAVLQAPGTVARGVSGTARAGVRATGDAVRGAGRLAGAAGSALLAGVEATLPRFTGRSYDEVQEQNRKASPVSEETVVRNFDEATALKEQIASGVASQLTDEQDLNASQSILEAGNFNPFRYANLSETSGKIREALVGVTDKATALLSLSSLVQKEGTSDQDKLAAAAIIKQIVEDTSNTLSANFESVRDKMWKGSVVEKQFSKFAATLNDLSRMPGVTKALDIAKDLTDKLDTSVDENPDQVQAPITGDQIAETLGLSTTNPTKVRPNLARRILKQAENGLILLSPDEQTQVRASIALAEAAREGVDQSKTLGLSRPVDAVSEQITVGESRNAFDPKSAVEQTNGIIAAVRQGDNESATARLQRLVDFAQHLQNKTDAMNRALATGRSKQNAQKFQALNNRTGKFFEGTSPFLDFNNRNSVQLAQRIGLEAQAVGKIANEMTKLFPGLNVSPVELVSLDPRLDRPAQEFVDEFRNARREEKLQEQAAKEAEKQSQVEEQQDAASVDAAIEEAVQEPEPTPEPNTEVVKEPEPTNEPEPAPQTEAAVEEKPQTEAVQEPVEQVSEPIAEPTKPKGFEGLFPQLVAGAKNWIRQAFRIPANARTRFFGQDEHLSRARDALGNSSVYSTLVGSDGTHTLTPEISSAYVEYLDLADGVMEELQANLERFLNSQFKKGVTMREALSQGEDINRFVRGRALNIVYQNDTGDFFYNPELVEDALLAGFQWMLDSNNRGSNVDTREAANILGIEEAEVTDDQIRFLSEGQSTSAAVRSLASMIERYWGLQSNPSAPEGYSRGIAEAVAGEIISALEAKELLGKRELIFSATNPEGKEDENKIWFFSPGQRHDENRYIMSDTVKNQALQAFPNAIERLMVLDPVLTDYIGEVPSRLAKTQLRNAAVPLTKQQTAAIEAEQKTPHFANVPVIRFYESLGFEGIRDLFGEGNLEKQVLNKNHRASLDGRNRTMLAAFEKLQSMWAQIQNVADTQDVVPGQVPVHYTYEFSRVNRMQMQGLHNPQANKLMREAIMPTRTTLDLSSQANPDFEKFMLAIAQAIEVKVNGRKLHQLSNKEAVDGALEKLGKMNSIPALTQWHNDGEMSPELIAQIKNDLGGDLSPVAVHALLDYARYRGSNDNSSFETNLYVEADGVTNGPVNAMALLTSGKFTPHWIRNMARGGLFFDGKTTLDQQGTENDLYGETSQTLESLMHSFVRDPEMTPEARNQMISAVRLMDLLLPGFTLNEAEGRLEIGRAVAKNPLTITIYGSGSNGIAGNITKELFDQVYARMSRAAAARAADENANIAMAMFGDLANGDSARAQELYDTFEFNIQNLLTKQARRRGTAWEVKDTYRQKAVNRGASMEAYTFDAIDFKAMQNNLHSTFVEPLVSSIRNTLAGNMLDNADTIRQATQVQGIFLKATFQAEINAALEAKKADPNFREGDFLSRTELDTALKNALKNNPLISTETQNLFVSGSQRADVKGPESFGRDFFEKTRSPAYVYGPRNPGVAGIPLSVISMGDGQMMQTLSTMEGAPQKTLKVFDGMHMALDTMVEDSIKANQAVFDSWQGNPLKAVLDSYAKFLSSDQVSNLETLPAEIKNELVQALFGLNAKDEDHSIKDVISAMQQLRQDLEATSTEVDARHRVMQRVKLSVDQMASIGSSYQTEGEDLSNLSSEAIAERLNEMLVEELGETESTQREVLAGAKTETSDLAFGNPDAADSIGRVGRVDSRSGARILSMNSVRQIRTLLNKTGVPQNQKDLLGDVVRSMRTKGYKIVFGTPEQVATYGANNGLPDLGWEPGVDGFTDVANQTIYLFTPSTETLVHELLHAATYETVAYYYFDENLGRDHQLISDAIGRIEELMNDFLALEPDVSKMDWKTQSAFRAAKDEITNTLNDPRYEDQRDRQAAAVNEFMSWALTNESLAKLGKQNKASRIAQIAREVIDKIKALIWGNKRVDKPLDDIFTNLRFNTNILLRSTPAPQTQFAEQFGQVKLFQRDQRFAEIDKALTEKVARYIGEEDLVREMQRKDLGDTQSKRASDNVRAIRIADHVARLFNAHGFPMTLQERTTFEIMMATMATGAELDGTSFAQLQDLYSHVEKNLKVEDFLPENASDQDRYYAQEKYDVLMGRYGIANDTLGRSSLLPAFLALSTVNEEFRNILSKMELPNREKSSKEGMDAILENLGSTMMDRLSRIMSGQDTMAEGRAKDVQEAIDALTERVVSVAQDRKTLFDQVGEGAASITDGVNNFIVNAMTSLARKSADKAREVRESTDNRAVDLATKVVEATAALIDLDTADQVGTDFVGALTRADMDKGLWRPFYDLMKDMIGRTQSNAQVYDMIKAVRSAIQQNRQQFRERLPQILEKKFSRKLESSEWTAMFKGLAKTDMAVLLQSSKLSQNEALELLTDPKKLGQRITQIEDQLRSEMPDYWQQYRQKSKELAEFMNTGKVAPGLLRNAVAIAALLGERIDRKDFNDKRSDKNLVPIINELVTLYSVESLDPASKDALSSLAQEEAEGVSFVLRYLEGQRRTEVGKVNESDSLKITSATLNHYKGYVPSESQGKGTLIVADDLEFSRLTSLGFQRVATYEGSSLENGPSGSGMSYYYLPVQARAHYNQGILQNIRPTAGGVDVATGLTYGLQTAGRITDPDEVARITKRRGRVNESGREVLMPVFDHSGEIIAYERSIDPVQAARIERNTHLGQMIGVWRGRQVEEAQSGIFNRALIDALKSMYDADAAQGKEDEYIDLFGKLEDPVLRDAVSLITQDTINYIKNAFGASFYVRRDLLDDTLGYRQASLGDPWTGNSRLDPKTRERIRRITTQLWGNDAYRYLVRGEEIIQNFVSDAKLTIVVKSVIVPAANAIANFYQLMGRGVPVTHIIRGIPKKVSEVDSFVRTRLRLMEAEAELRAVENDPVASRKLQAEIRSIKDAHKRLSIWPLIEAGEFNSISDADITHDELNLTSGRLNQYIEGLVDRLPDSVRNLGRYAIVSRDTALFQGLQRSIEYGDFLAKAVLYDDLTRRKDMSKADALARITEEFVNYDRLPGRFRGYVESMGLLWFWNFKVRSVKVALSTIRNNPVHAFMAGMAPQPELFGSVGSPIDDNLFSVAADGRLDYSVGPTQGFRAYFLNPWYNLIS